VRGDELILEEAAYPSAESGRGQDDFREVISIEVVELYLKCSRFLSFVVDSQDLNDSESLGEVTDFGWMPTLTQPETVSAKQQRSYFETHPAVAAEMSCVVELGWVLWVSQVLLRVSLEMRNSQD
jgi:hypothetical protein